MDEARYRIRAMRDSDYPGEARVWTVLDGTRAISEEQLRRGDQSVSQPPMVCVKTVVEDWQEGNAVAFGHLANAPDRFHPRKFWVGIGIDPAHQNRGLGRALADAVEGEAAGRGALVLWTAAREDNERGMRFWPRRGFVETRRVWSSRLDLASAKAPPDRSEELARRGVTFTTFAQEGPERPDVFQQICELTAAAMADAPRNGPFTPEKFQRFLNGYLRGPTQLPEAMFLARQGGRYVGVCLFERHVEAGRLHQLFTGTVPAARGQGIASELKRRSLEYGRSHGFREFTTDNDSTNQAMWAINERLGYRREQVWVESEKSLGPDPDADAAPAEPG